MYIRCRFCDLYFEIRENIIGHQGRKVRCAYCQSAFWVQGATPLDEKAAAVPVEECEHTLLLNFKNKPAVPQRELRKQLQGGQDPASLNASKADEEPPPARVANMTEVTEPARTTDADYGSFWRLEIGREVKADLLKQSGWFENIPSLVDWPALADPWKFFKADPCAYFIRPGDNKRYLGVVIEGFVRIFRPPTNDGRKELSYVLGAGHSFGETSLFRAGIHQLFVSAHTETTVALLSEKSFLLLADQHPLVFYHLILELATRMAHCLTDVAGGPLESLHASLLGSSRDQNPR